MYLWSHCATFFSFERDFGSVPYVTRGFLWEAATLSATPSVVLSVSSSHSTYMYGLADVKNARRNLRPTRLNGLTKALQKNGPTDLPISGRRSESASKMFFGDCLFVPVGHYRVISWLFRDSSSFLLRLNRIGFCQL